MTALDPGDFAHDDEQRHATPEGTGSPTAGGVGEQGDAQVVIVGGRRGGKNLRSIEQFNKVCPVGTPVLYWPGELSGESRKSTTRSKAWLLGGHTPVVMVEGYAGGIALSHVMGIAGGADDRG